MDLIPDFTVFRIPQYFVEHNSESHLISRCLYHLTSCSLQEDICVNHTASSENSREVLTLLCEGSKVP